MLETRLMQKHTRRLYSHKYIKLSTVVLMIKRNISVPHCYVCSRFVERTQLTKINLILPIMFPTDCVFTYRMLERSEGAVAVVHMNRGLQPHFYLINFHRTSLSVLTAGNYESHLTHSVAFGPSLLLRRPTIPTTFASCLFSRCEQLNVYASKIVLL